jgi:hypothetical protein
MLFKNPVRTSKRTPHFTITTINWLTLFKFKVYNKKAELQHTDVAADPCLSGVPRSGGSFCSEGSSKQGTPLSSRFLPIHLVEETMW